MTRATPDRDDGRLVDIPSGAAGTSHRRRGGSRAAGATPRLWGTVVSHRQTRCWRASAWGLPTAGVLLGRDSDNVPVAGNLRAAEDGELLNGLLRVTTDMKSRVSGLPAFWAPRYERLRTTDVGFYDCEENRVAAKRWDASNV